MSTYMKATLLNIVSILCLLGSNIDDTCAQNINTTTSDGEYAHYKVYYNWHFIWLNAGEVTFSTQKTGHNNQQLFKLQAIGKTIGNYDHFFFVRDTFISVTDTLTLQPHTFYQSNYEGKKIVRNTYHFDHGKQRISGTEYIKDGRTIKSNKKIDIPWDGNSFDVMTMVYKARNINFSQCQVGDKIPISMIINAQVYNLYIRYLGRETITTKHGQTYQCQKFSPLLVEGTIFAGGEDMTVWVTDDEWHVPVVVEAKILIGSVKAILDKYENKK